jgi:membrane-associated protease RseP (regulator of RpoE activity)
MSAYRSRLLAVAIASTLVAGFGIVGAAHSRDGDGPTPEQRRELDAARADVQRAAKRLAELSRLYGSVEPGMPGPAFALPGMPPERRPLIGVLLAPDAQGGVRISGVTPGGAAADAGLRSGDRLLRIGGKAIAGATPEARVEAARALLQGADTKTPVKLLYARDGREAELAVTPKLDDRIMIFAGEGQMMRPGNRVIVRRVGDREELEVDGVAMPPGPAWQGAPGGMQMIVAPGEGQRRIVRIECRDDGKDGKDCTETVTGGQAIPGMPPMMFDIDVEGVPGDALREVRMLRVDCKPGEACDGPIRLAEAFRWNGLNLASVDPQLGRYFGTDKGVLVLSTGPALGELQAGDVIQRVDGKAVDTPRAVMNALREKPADSTVSVDYLRDRRSASARIQVPKAMPLAPMAPLPPPPSRVD